MDIAIGFLLAVVAGGVLYGVRRTQIGALFASTQKQVQQTLEQATKDSQKILAKAHLDSQEILSKARSGLEDEIQARRQTMSQQENRLMQKEKHLDQRDQRMIEKEASVQAESDRIRQLRQKEEAVIRALSEKLEQAAGFSAEEARDILLSNVERETRQRAGKLIKEIEDQARKTAKRRAKEIVTDAIQRTAIDHVPSATTSSVQLTDDELKGRIIGREGRNIRAFEAATGVDVIVDDTPGTVILSCFDPLRREIAKIALSKLIADGRIHPARIEDAVEKAKKELHDTIIEKGEQAADAVGLQFHPKIIELLGKLHYRTSYGQNILAHSIEAAHIAGIMADELKVNAALAKRGAMLHDIGKALDFEQGGSHDDLGKEVCIKYGESDEVINCIMAHHEDEDPDTIEAILVKMADAISATRPGARRESVEAYIKRLEKLEAIALSYDGVEKAYAIQAGREVRVIVRPDEIDDPGIHRMALEMAKKIETDMDYPGEVKVSVIRETRAVGVAK